MDNPDCSCKLTRVRQVSCYGECAGAASSKGTSTGECPGALAFPAGAPGFTGFGKVTWLWSVVDQVPHHGLSSNTMALITSDCGKICSPSFKWP